MELCLQQEPLRVFRGQEKRVVYIQPLVNLC